MVLENNIIKFALQTQIFWGSIITKRHILLILTKTMMLK